MTDSLERMDARLKRLVECGEKEIGVALQPEYKSVKKEKKTRYGRK